MAKKVREDIVSYPGGQFDRTKHVFRSIGFREIISSSRRGLDMVTWFLSKETKSHAQAHEQGYSNNSI
jgi:hypothetical protein